MIVSVFDAFNDIFQFQDILVAVSKSGNGKLKLANTNPRFGEYCLDLSADSISIEKDGSNWSNYFLCGIKVKTKHENFYFKFEQLRYKTARRWRSFHFPSISLSFQILIRKYIFKQKNIVKVNLWPNFDNNFRSNVEKLFLNWWFGTKCRIYWNAKKDYKKVRLG